MRNTLWAVGWIPVMAAAAGFGYGIGVFVLLLASTADLFSLKGHGPDEEPRFLDGFGEWIVVGCILLVVASCAAVYLRAWRQDLRRGT